MTGVRRGAVLAPASGTALYAAILARRSVRQYDREPLENFGQ